MKPRKHPLIPNLYFTSNGDLIDRIAPKYNSEMLENQFFVPFSTQGKKGFAIGFLHANHQYEITCTFTAHTPKKIANILGIIDFVGEKMFLSMLQAHNTGRIYPPIYPGKIRFTLRTELDRMIQDSREGYLNQFSANIISFLTQSTRKKNKWLKTQIYTPYGEHTETFNLKLKYLHEFYPA